MSSPDMDVDVGGTPEPESMGADDMARDGESDLVVQQLERGLPRWEDLGDSGWLKEMEGSEDRRLELVLAVKGHKDAVYVSSPLFHSSPGADLNVPSVAIAMQLRSRPCQRKPISLTCHSAYVTASCVTPVSTVFDFCPFLFQSPLSLKLIEVLSSFCHMVFPAYIPLHRAVRVPMVTRPTKHLTRKLRSCLKKRVGGMNLEATRMGMSCYFKYVPANTVPSCPRLHPLPAPVSGSHVTRTPIWTPLCFIHQLRLTPCRPWYCTSTPLF